MNATTAPVVRATIVAVDLAKSVFQLVVADGSWKVVESHRLTRTQFERWFINRRIDLVIQLQNPPKSMAIAMLHPAKANDLELVR